jgi:hypothetical protein
VSEHRLPFTAQEADVHFAGSAPVGRQSGESDRRFFTGTSLAAETAFFATSKSLSLAKHLLSTSYDTVSGAQQSQSYS